jgi:hypothetical protein
MENQLSRANVQSVVQECTRSELPSLEDPSKEQIILQEIIKNPHLFGRGFLLGKSYIILTVKRQNNLILKLILVYKYI